MVDVAAGEPLPRAAAEALGDAESIRLLAELVAIAPTNLEDPLHDRYEKPNYRRAADRIVRAARDAGLATRLFDPIVDGPHVPELRGIPRPSVVVDLDAHQARTVLILAHYDVVPVPAEQLGRWRSPPHVLTYRSNGRLYGRGANDDLGSGVVASLLAMRRLADGPAPRANVRLVLCCDEETGGEGGIEQVKAHDERLPEDDPGRFLVGDVALIPDGSPHATASSSGLVFLDGSFDGPSSLRECLDYADRLIALHDRAKTWRSVYASPDWPQHGAPEPVITGRATLTKFDVGPVAVTPTGTQLLAAHAETDAANQIAQSVTLVVSGPGESVDALFAWLGSSVRLPFHVAPPTGTALTVPPAARAIQVVGESSHGGYPHRGANPVPETVRLLRGAMERGLLPATAPAPSTFSVDLRLIPEMTLESGRDTILAELRASLAAGLPNARAEAPLARARRGYCLSPDHPDARRLERLCRELFDAPGVFGEYGGTDASSLIGVRTPGGDPMPALVFGSMDRDAHIHEAEESADPGMIARVAKLIERFVREP
ncbi:MAG: M20/M25/M40 family metallo-hydrolase [Thermoplasmata archaeon]|nr:M20/M25/M40 family metallo-hydrolase [Thermoplasmata archaeon]